MSEMIERVARAICKAEIPDAPYDDHDWTEFNRAHWHHVARAAIEAIVSETPDAVRFLALGIAHSAPGAVGDSLEDLRLAIEVAILAERERCAKIADDYPNRDPGGDGNGYWAAEEIACAIRSPSNTETPT
jgi:hypothetical protein